MSTTATPEQTSTSAGQSRPGEEHAVRAIIAAARGDDLLPARVSWLCGAASALLWFASFHPLDWGPLAFLAPVPLLLLARVINRPRHLYRAVYVTWLAASLAQLSWMAANLPMVAGWLAISIVMAIYPVLFLAGCRVATGRLKLPLVLAAPILWTGLEFLRAHLFTGFSWYYLGHTQWHWTTLIQISDLVGAYGVSFVVMTAAAALAVWIPREWLARLVGGADPLARMRFSHAGDMRRGRIVSIGGALALLAATLGYGAWRLSNAEFTAGPRMALVQGNFPSRLYQTATPGEVWSSHNRMTAMSVAYQPDFIIWPESAFRWTLFDMAEQLSDIELEGLARRTPYDRLTATDWRSASASVRQQLGDLATQANAAMLIGTSAIDADAEEGIRRFNSAVFSEPEIGVTGRYDKQHRVMFGEYIPLREQLPFLQALSPYTDNFSIDAGDSTAVFKYQDVSIAPLICFEDTVPHLVRSMVAAARKAERPIDVLVNVSNDGWFDHSAEQPQHLVTSLFRAVETRTPLVRAANTGVSAAIDGSGQLIQPAAFIPGTATIGEDPESLSMFDDSGNLRKDLEAVLIADVPLDPRRSLYVRAGDWFAGLCGAVCCFVLAWGVWRRKRPVA